MENKPKRKKRTELIVFLVVFAILILIPVGFYGYLSFDHFHIDDMRQEYDREAPYTGTVSYQANGDVELPLSAGDIYWLADEYDVIGSLNIPLADIRNFAVAVDEDALTLYADIRLWDSFPLPVKATATVRAGDALEISVKSVWLGKWIEIPAEKLEKYGLKSSYSIAYGDIIDNANIESMFFEDGRVEVVLPFLNEFSEDIRPDMTADILLLYGAESDSFINTASACYRAADEGARRQVVCESVANAKDPVEAMKRLLAFCDAGLAADIINRQEPYASHFLLPVSIEEVSACRTEYAAGIVDYNRKLETMLNALIQRYRGLEIKLNRDAYVDVTTGEMLSLAALCPELGLDDTQCHPVLLAATETKKAAAAADLPAFSEIPKTRGLKLDMALDYMPYAIGLMLQMPDGSTALLYYAATGEMVVQCLPQETAQSTFAEYQVPKILNLDFAVFAPQRVIHDAPAFGLSSYIVFLPWDIEAIRN